MSSARDQGLAMERASHRQGAVEVIQPRVVKRAPRPGIPKQDWASLLSYCEERIAKHYADLSNR